MSQDHAPLRKALSAKYEDRTTKQHKRIVDTLAPLFPTFTLEKIKLLSFFIELQQPNSPIKQKYTPNSFVITPTQNPEQPFTIQTLTKTFSPLQQFSIMLDYEKYLNADLLGATSIEKELSFWQSSQYFCSLPKKKLLELIRLAKVMLLNENQCVYIQGQQVTEQESGSGVYVVRSGELGCFHFEGREIEANRFQKGDLFGTLELIGNGGKGTPYRVTTVRCKTSSAIVYNFTEAIFNQLMLHYCQTLIQQKQEKLLKFIPHSQLQKSKSHSFSNHFSQSKITYPSTLSSLALNSLQKSNKLQQTERRAFPSVRLQQIRQTATTTFYKSTLRESERLEGEGLRKTNYLSLKQGPLCGYPLAAQRSNFLTSEFKDLQKLIEKSPMKQQSIEKRDVLRSFYRETLYRSLKRGHE